MNRRGLPPDRDNDLRRAISLNRDEQVRLLHGLAGEQIVTPLSPKSGGSFTHYGATTTTGPRGALVYMPTPIPSNVAGAGRRRCIHQRRPRRA